MKRFRVPRPSATTARVCALLALALSAACSAPQARYRSSGGEPPTAEGVLATLFLLGDAGEVNPNRDAVLERLRREVDAVARDGQGPPVAVVYLGDNIYEEGVREDAPDEDVAKLDGQVLALGDAPNVRGYFVPGNHDWANGASLADGRAAVLRQERWIESVGGGKDVRFLPDDGCPGPVGVDLVDGVRLVFLDTEWLLRSPEERCGTSDDAYAALSAELRAHRDRRVVLLSHHPLASGGPHGGHVAPLERGPLVYYLAAKSGVIMQDLGSPAYTAMREATARAIEASGAPPLVQAAGHDHDLQVIRMGGPAAPAFQLVSGAASRSNPARRIDGTRYAADGYGFMRLDFLADATRVTVYRRPSEGGGLEVVFACRLTPSDEPGACPEAPRAREDE